MRRFITGLATLTALAVGLPMVVSRAEAAAIPAADGLRAAIDTFALTETVQLYVWGAAGIAGTTTVGRARAGIGAAMHGVEDLAGAADMAGMAGAADTAATAAMAVAASTTTAAEVAVAVAASTTTAAEVAVAASTTFRAPRVTDCPNNEPSLNSLSSICPKPKDLRLTRTSASAPIFAGKTFG